MLVTVFGIVTSTNWFCPENLILLLELIAVTVYSLPLSSVTFSGNSILNDCAGTADRPVIVAVPNVLSVLNLKSLLSFITTGSVSSVCSSVSFTSASGSIASASSIISKGAASSMTIAS